MSDNPDTTTDITVKRSVTAIYPDGTPILYHGNPAEMDGILHETGEFVVRDGTFDMFLEHYAVAMSNGKLAVDSIQSVSFITNRVADPRSFAKVCPPTARRIREFDDEAARTSGSAYVPIKSIPTSLEHQIIIAPWMVKAKSKAFCAMLENILSQWEEAETMIEQAKGDGHKLLELMRDEGNKASPADHTLISMNFNRLKDAGIAGELDVIKVRDHFKAYLRAKRKLTAAERASITDASEIQYVNSIAYRDPAIRDRYSLKQEIKAPSTFAEATELLKATLRSMATLEKIDQENSRGQALAANSGGGGGGGGGKPDPNKNRHGGSGGGGGGGGAKKVQPPRRTA